MKKILCAVTLGLLLSGCATTLLSNERIISNTAGVLGISPDDITISNRRTEMVNTYYIAKTKKGAVYACAINGGNLLTAGMVNAPTCKKK